MQLFRPITIRYLSNKFLAATIVSIFLTWGAPANSNEPFLDFLQGLRDRGYFDTAIEYIDQLSQRNDVPQDVVEILDLEQGLTYRASASASKTAADRDRALNAAEASLVRFVEQNGSHPKAALANAEIGQLLLNRARQQVWNSAASTDGQKKKLLQRQARTTVRKAKNAYRLALDQYKEQRDSFPRFIDEVEDPELHAKRSLVEGRHLRVSFNLARCAYEQGQTYSEGEPDRDRILNLASKEFEELYTAWRNNPIGLQARLMMGKCLQEQGDIDPAIGIYNEMLSHGSTQQSVQRLQAIALQYRLICLNHESKNDSDLVIQEAIAWLKNEANQERIFTEAGLGILWQKALAEESISKQRDVDPKRKTTALQHALTDARQVSRFPGPFQQPAISLTRQMNDESGESDSVPKTFDTAFERARGAVSLLTDLQRELKTAKSDESRAKTQKAIRQQLSRIAQLFERALQLRNAKTDPAAVAQSRYLLSYVYMRQRKSFDAVILATYCMTKDQTNDPESSLNATEVAINAGVQALSDAPENDRSFELNLLKTICEQIIQLYPQSARCNEARVRLGQVYRDLEQPVNAAETYLTVPPDDAGYGPSRIHAGQSYWLAWALNADAVATTNQEFRPEWKTHAKHLLQQGIELTRQPENRRTPEVFAAEVSLATILNMEGNFEQTIQRLTSGEEQSVLKETEVPVAEEESNDKIDETLFTAQIYRLLLRAYVGTQRIDDALNMMRRLESVGEQDVAAVYTQLGRELQQELKRLSNVGDTDRLVKVRSSFEQFLEKVNSNRDTSDFRSLLWIAETYFGLGQSGTTDSDAASLYFNKASQAYEDILAGNLAEKEDTAAIKLRLLRCHRAQGSFSHGIALAKEILATSPYSVDVQFEAAHLLADWGADESGDPAKLLAAIDGVEETIWGWKRLARQLETRKETQEWNTFRDRYLEARFECSQSRLRYAKREADHSEQQLKSGQVEVLMFTQVSTDLDDEWFAKFKQLYHDLQVARGREPVALQRRKPSTVPVVDNSIAATPVEPEKNQPAKIETPTIATEPRASDSPNLLLLMTLSLALAACGAGVFYKLLSKPKRRRQYSPLNSQDSSAVPDFGTLTKTTEPATASTSPPATSTPKKKRILSPDQAARRKAARLAKARANAERGASPNPSPDNTGEPSASISQPTAKLKRRRRPPPDIPS